MARREHAAERQWGKGDREIHWWVATQIQDSVLSSKPTTIADAIHMAANLTDNHVKAGTLTRKGFKKDKDQSKGPNEPTKEEIKASFNTLTLQQSVTCKWPVPSKPQGNQPEERLRGSNWQRRQHGNLLRRPEE
ncbi:hypothetical protein E3N88_02882 [Mikania micrantha]|uniref:Uncharacterized protein n=1 Tax=Mikania micrantha TaxID=192012 RepID=A0A5N6Q6U4_9ASTR|nr:hypothetical protein E3N88_02882 [Mikania micrantha]